MAVWAQTDFTGGAPGTPASLATEPAFDAQQGNGSATYREVVGVGQGVEFSANAGWTFSLALERSVWRMGWRCTFLTSTSTSTYHFMVTAYFGGASGTVGWDIGLRNASGQRHAATRNNFAYFGEAAGNTMAPNETWSFEAVYDDGALTVLAWEGLDTSTAPSYTWTATYTLTEPDTVRIGNAAGNTGVGMILSDFWATDGERLDPTPQPGSVVWAHNGYTRQTEFAVNVRTDSADTGGIEYDTDPGFLGPVTVAGADKGDGYWQATATDLEPDTTYYWRALADGAPSTVTGQSKTLPASGALRLGWGSCFDSYTSGVFPLIAGREPDAFIMLGDYGYAYITGGPNGNTSPTDLATVRAHREPVLTAPGPRTLFATIGHDYTYSDCDGAGANADGTTGGHATGAVQEAYRQQFAHPDLPLEDSGARSWVWGRVRIIHTDETPAASVRDSTDNATKTKLGAEQKAWFKAEIDAAALAGQAVIWFGDGPWIEPPGAGSATYNSFARYNTERTELGAYIANSGVPLMRLHGDTHTLFLDDGTNNPWGGFPTASAAPIHTTAQAFGTTTSGPSYPSSTTNGSRQYGICDIDDDGESLTVTLRGYSSTAAAPTEVERFSESFILLEQDSPAELTATTSRTVTGSATLTAPAIPPAELVAATGITRAGSATLTTPAIDPATLTATATLTRTGEATVTAPAISPATLTATGSIVRTGTASVTTPDVPPAELTATTARTLAGAATVQTPGIPPATLTAEGTITRAGAALIITPSIPPTTLTAGTGLTRTGTTTLTDPGVHVPELTATTGRALAGVAVLDAPVIPPALLAASVGILRAGVAHLGNHDQRDITITIGPPARRRLDLDPPTGRPFAVGTPRR